MMKVGNRFLMACSMALALLAIAPGVWAQKSATIGGTGRIAPLGGVMTLTNPGGRQEVARVLVREGDKVKKGDVLVVFADRAQREADREAVEQRLRGLDDAFAEREKVMLLEREAVQTALAVAKSEQQNFEGLDERTVSARDRRSRVQTVAGAELQLRLVDARLVEARKAIVRDRQQARAQLEQARVQVAQTQLLAPGPGTVVELMARPGMILSGTPAMTVADTSAMYVNADFFEGDLARIKPGMKAKVNNAALGGAVTGVVEKISRLVDAGSRLAKVSIRLDQPTPADQYIGMQVDVTVDPSTGAK